MSIPPVIVPPPAGGGLTLILEPMADVESAAFSLLVPAGTSWEPAGGGGTAAAAVDWMLRGAGPYGNREFSDALDHLGVQRHESVAAHQMAFHGACLGDNLPAILKLYGELVRAPRLEEEFFEPVISGAEQSLLAIEDDPQKKVMVELTRRSYPDPWGRPSEGNLTDLEQATPDSVRQFCRDRIRPQGAILGLAGKIDPDRLIPQIQAAFAGWDRPPVDGAPSETGDFTPGFSHLTQDSTQTHIGVAFPAVPYRDPDYYAAWAAVDILSGGMSSRLFTEVREKRGLCYSVYASLHSLRHAGRVLCYAGTTSERAQATLDVLLVELKRLANGIEPAELARCQARAKSSLIMAQESTGARASSAARDWFHLGRVTSLEEVRGRIEALTVDSVLDYLRRHPAESFSILTVGPEPLAQV